MIDYSVNNKDRKLTRQPQSSLVNLFSAEVVDIILSKDHKDFIKMGGNTSIGFIKYRLMESNRTTNEKSLSYAIPLHPHHKNYPLKGEIVLIYSGLPTKTSTSKDSQSLNYYMSGINIFNDSQINSLQHNSAFPVSTNHSPILPSSGDVITEGRFQNSLRFTADTGGNPMTIIRNGRKLDTNSGEFTQEDINNDDSLIIFSSNQPVSMNVAYNELKSFSINMVKTDSTNISQVDLTKNVSKIDLTQIVKTDLPQNDDTQTQNVVFDEEVVDYALPENEDITSVQLDEVIEDEHASFSTQQNFNEVIKGKELPKLHKPVSFDKAVKYIGKLERDIPNHIKAIIEVLTFCEGTLGLGENNGYDAVVLDCRSIANWTNEYKLGCPYQPVYSRKGLLFQKGGHWGKYQYQKSTWVLDAGTNIAFSKRNQDLICAKTIRRRLGHILYDNLYQTMQNINGVYQVCSKLAPEWASIPYGNSTTSYYNGQKVRIYPTEIQKLYNIAYKIYQTT